MLCLAHRMHKGIYWMENIFKTVPLQFLKHILLSSPSSSLMETLFFTVVISTAISPFFLIMTLIQHCCKTGTLAHFWMYRGQNCKVKGRRPFGAEVLFIHWIWVQKVTPHFGETWFTCGSLHSQNGKPEMALEIEHTAAAKKASGS